MTFFFLLAELEGMPPSDEGDCSGVLSRVLTGATFATGSFVPKGSCKKSSRLSASAVASLSLLSGMSLGGVGGRMERD